MSATTRLPFILSTLALASSTALLARHAPHSVRRRLPRRTLSMLASFFVLLNFKNLPWAWHVRVLRAILHQLYLTPAPLRQQHLFTPLVTTTRNSLWDCDYNLHKSNSTYFADLDVARAHYVGALIRTGLRRLNSGDTQGLALENTSSATTGKKKAGGGGGGGGGYIIALGAVACSFRKEVAPLAKVEIWTRVLSWDDKWLYIVSHVVKPGTIRPRGWFLQPWKAARANAKGKNTSVALDSAALKSAVYATSVAKYVCKKGRATIPPHVLLERSRLLPPGPKPAADDALAGSEAELVAAASPAALVSSGADTPASGLEGVESAAPALAEAWNPRPNKEEEEEEEQETSEEQEELSWERVEEMRLRGLKYASMFDGLAGLHEGFGADAVGGEEDVLGVYGDLLY